MAILTVKTYPTKLFLKAADHTYVECGTGAKGWACWGGKTGGTALRSGSGSSKRANAIAGAKERAGITCYLVNGVCHQAANRILLPAGITVRGARGYAVSEAMFGTYGRVHFWPCKAPFDRKASASGDLPECVPSGAAARLDEEAPATDADQRDWAYTRSVIALYADAKPLQAAAGRQEAARSRTTARKLEAELEVFHLALFRNQCEFNLGPMFDRRLERTLLAVRRRTERARVTAERARGSSELRAGDFVQSFNDITIKFQQELAESLTGRQYQALLGLKREDEPIILADPAIIEAK